MKKLFLTILMLLVATVSFAANPAQYPLFQAIDANGNPVAGGLVYTYEPGTSNNKAAYTDKDFTTPASNPITLDSKGEAQFYLKGTYKINVKTSAGVQVTGWPVDNITGDQEGEAQDNYYPDYSEADQGVTGSSTTIRYYVDLAAAATPDLQRTIVLRNNSGSATTTYTLTTSETIPSNITLKFERGAVIDGAGTLTVNGGLDTGITKIFGSNITVTGTPDIEKVYPQWWNDDIGDGTEIANTAVTSADSLAANIGGEVYFIDGIYPLDAFVYPTASFNGTGTLKADATWADSNNSGMLRIDVPDIKIKNLTFDGNSLTGAITIKEAGHRVVIDSITSNNAYNKHITSAGNTTQTEGIVIKNCYLTNAGMVNTSGDAIYLYAGKNCKVINNIIEGASRDGIVFEGGVTLTSISENPYISGNTIKNLHSTDSENAGIWVESCNGAIITENQIDSITHDTKYKAKGIVRGGLGGSPIPDELFPFIISDNQINNVYVGIKGPGEICSNNVISNFKTGLWFSNTVNALKGSAVVSNIKFSDSTFDNDRHDYPIGGGALPNCLFLMLAQYDIDIVVDGVVVENITRETSEPLLSDVFFPVQNSSTYTASSISFTASDNSINDSASGFSANPGEWVYVTGSGSNDGTYLVETATTSKLTLATDEATVSDESAGASVSIETPVTLGSFTLKNVSAPDEIIVRSASDDRVTEIHLDNVPLTMSLGSQIKARDKVTINNCRLTAVTQGYAPAKPLHADFIRITDCVGIVDFDITAGPLSSSIAERQLIIKGNYTDTDRKVEVDDSFWVHVSDNIVDSYNTTPLIDATTTCKGSFSHNGLINNSGGRLLETSGGTSVFVLSDNYRDDATAIFNDTSGAATITENQTTQL